MRQCAPLATPPVCLKWISRQPASQHIPQLRASQQRCARRAQRVSAALDQNVPEECVPLVSLSLQQASTDVASVRRRSVSRHVHLQMELIEKLSCAALQANGLCTTHLRVRRLAL